MFRPRVILGPPGCGKTERLLRLAEAEIERGVPPDRIAFVTFTRAARWVALDRMGRQLRLDERALPWVRTVHSMAYRLLSLSRDAILNDERWAEFGARYGYTFTPHGARAYEPDRDIQRPVLQTDEDIVRYVHDWGRNCRLTLEESLARCPVQGVKSRLFDQFVRRLGDFKLREGLVDFPDLLQGVLEVGRTPDVDVAFIDEAQDLSPLQIAVCEMWFANCQQTYVAGDDDQAVYRFQGANPAWLLDLASRGVSETLEQSYRVPIAPYLLAQRVIAKNRERVSKQYRPTSTIGEVRHADRHEVARWLDAEVETLVLARNRAYLRPFAKELLGRRLPYLLEGSEASSPLSNGPLVTAVRAAKKLGDPNMAWIHASELKGLLDFIPSSSGLVPWGAKRQIGDLAERGESLAWSDLAGDLGLERLLSLIEDGGVLSVLKASSLELAYLNDLVEKYGEIPEPRIVLTTIHAAKGREADRVVVLPDMARATYKEYCEGGQEGFEAENRVFYVAFTRAKKTLVLVAPRGRRYFSFPSADVVTGVA